MERSLSASLLLDGATGTQLQKQGMPRGVCTEQWILEHPGALLKLQRDYVDAGVQVLTAPTFGANPAALERFGLRRETACYNQRLVALSRQAAEGRALVAGDLAPCGMTGACVEEKTENYAVQVRALRDAGVDLYLVETMLTWGEICAAIGAVRQNDPGKRLWVSCVCSPEGRMSDGNAVEAVFSAAQAMGVDALGLNCMPPADLHAQLKKVAPMTKVPLLARPGRERAEEDTPAEWAERYAALGVTMFGGCCGTDPAMIADLGRVLRQI